MYSTKNCVNKRVIVIIRSIIERYYSLIYTQVNIFLRIYEKKKLFFVLK